MQKVYIFGLCLRPDFAEAFKEFLILHLELKFWSVLSFVKGCVAK